MAGPLPNPATVSRFLSATLSLIALPMLSMACTSWFTGEERSEDPTAQVALEEREITDEASIAEAEAVAARTVQSIPEAVSSAPEVPADDEMSSVADDVSVVASVPQARPVQDSNAGDAAPDGEPEIRFVSEPGLIRPPNAEIKANPFLAGRSMTPSREGIVASSHVYASEAGIQILREGGNAMDAAIAAAAVLAVVEPMMTGLGGDVWMLVYDAKSGKVHALNGTGRSPQGLTREYFANKAEEKIDASSWESVTVPGTVDGWVTGLERFGSRPLSELLAPAIHYAEDGFPVSEIIASYWRAFAPGMREDPLAEETYLPGGEAPRFGEVFKNPRIAKTLRQIAEGGRDAFYRGPIAREIVRYAQATGGFLSLEDFAQHRSTWVEPISTNYRGYEIYQCPPNGQGIAALIMLNMLEGFDIGSMKPDSVDLHHLFIESKKLAYADVSAYVSDPDTLEFPVAELLSKEHAGKRVALIDPAKAMALPEPDLPAGTDTVYLCTVDREGNAVSLINTVFSGFGSKRVGGETGIVMQNRGSGFSLEPGHPNEYAPGKLAFHTNMPGMVTRDGKLYLAYGVMGGAYQPQGHVHLLVHHLDFGFTVQEAIDTPRWRHQAGMLTMVEHGTPEALAEGLRQKGHIVRGTGRALLGGAQAIWVDPETGTYFGASDPRKDGAAIGY